MQIHSGQNKTKHNKFLRNKKKVMFGDVPEKEELKNDSFKRKNNFIDACGFGKGDIWHSIKM